MGLASLVLDIPSNVEIIKNSMMRWRKARVSRMKFSEITQKGNDFSGNRWKIIDEDGGLLDNAQGYGFKSPYNAQKVIDYMKGRKK